ncbi:MAG TPA: hypothetical protein VGH98_01805 [Gemmatimonadaceae bacterium]|jgi:hypothetical protein
MRSKQNAVQAALLRAQRFATENAAQLMSSVDLTVARQRLDDVIASFATHAVDQDANSRSAKGETEKQHQLRIKLRTEQMQPIADVARRNLRTAPEFKELQMPPRTAKGGAFFASAQAMLNAASIHKDALLERGLPSDFLEQFQSSLTKLQTSMSDRDKSRTVRKGATKGLAFQEQEGRNVLRVLDASVRRALSGNAALLETWQSARTIQGGKVAPATTSAAEQPTQPTATAAPASTATATVTPPPAAA